MSYNHQSTKLAYPDDLINKKDLLWIEFTPYKIDKQTMDVRNSESYLKTLPGGLPIRLVAPMDIQENITHNWNDYENMVGRAGQLLNKYYKGAKSIGSAGEAAIASVAGADVNKMLSTDITGETSANVSVPLVFEGSNRREYSMMFQLADKGDTKRDVFDPVQFFREKTSAEIENHITIKFPHIFTIKSIPNGIINMKYAAIVAVQPNFQGPYRNGYPSRCELTLSFRDMSPLFITSWSESGAAGIVSTRKDMMSEADQKEILDERENTQ